MKRTSPWQDDAGLFKHGTLMMAGTLAGAVCNAGFHMVVGRTLKGGGAEYGALVAMMGLILTVTTPMLAVQNTLAHFISRLQKENRREEIRGFFLHWVRIFLWISLGIVAGAFLLRSPLSRFWPGVEERLVVVTFIVLAGSLWMSLFNGLWQGTQSFVWLAFAPQSWGLVRLGLGGVFTAFISATALAAVYAQGAGVLVVVVLGILFFLHLDFPTGPGRGAPHETYRYLGSALVCLAGYGVLMNLDTTLARHYFDAETAGVFAKAATIARTAVFLPVPIAAALFPKVTSSGALSTQSWRLLWRAIGITSLIIAAVVMVCLLLPQVPWMILYGAWQPEEARSAAALTQAMVLAMMPLSLAYVLLTFEMAQQRFRWGYGLAGCALGYVVGVGGFHATPLQIPLVLAISNAVAVLLLLVGIFTRPRTA
ncbi:MAG: hypothetical protein LBN38_08015 [Verrucomicrobiota bacterium]|jgi:O-antigen/teichoic acid export membrane protein|nr:hypothetical protein [Verrucomicrobiota bacterium]